MAGLIKNQILKHLSIFTKNLSPDKIQLSTLRGEGNLSGLELDENVLTEVLDLPSWLQISKAVCNKVSVRIPWTKLKSRPICLYLDEVTVDMETCAELRKPTSTSVMSAYSTGGKYGFAERIIDGMYISVNSVQVNFQATAFTASIQLSRLVVESRCPTWREAATLSQTRIQHASRGHILLFKEASWQTLRVEANALGEAADSIATTPLRLIANQSKIRITMKKKLSDCRLIASRLQVNLDDLLWVLTDLQLKAALVFVNSLKEIIKKSTQQSKLLAADKLKQQGQHASPVHTAPTAHAPVGSVHEINALFQKYDVAETSYHLHTGRIDLHLCDDATADATYQRRVEGGAMQLTLYKLELDYYPFHPAGADRSRWIHHDENMATRDAWVRGLLDAFKSDVRRARDVFLGKAPATDAANGLRVAPPSATTPPQQQQQQPTPQTVLVPPAPTAQRQQPAQLLESCVVVRIEDLVVYQVSTSDGRGGGGGHAPRPLVCSEKKLLLLPPDMILLHVEFTEYYFPHAVDFPVPSSNLYTLVNPIKLNVDFLTLVWLNSFTLNLTRHLELPQATGPNLHVDFKLEALMPKVVLTASDPPSGQPDRPTVLHLRASRLMLTNCRSDTGKSSRDDLAATLDAFRDSALYYDADFPNDAGDSPPLSDVFRRHVSQTDGAYVDSSVECALMGIEPPPPGSAIDRPASSGGASYYNMRTDSFKRHAAKDVWCVDFEQVWAELLGVANARGRPVSLLESCPVTLWMHVKPASVQSRFNDSATTDPPLHPSCMTDPGEQMKKAVAASRVNSHEMTCFSDKNSTAIASPGVDWSHLNDSHALASQTNEEGSPADNAVLPDLLSPLSDSSRMDDHDGTGPLIRVAVAVPSRIRVQLDHYTLLFLLRLVDAVTECQAQVAEDMSRLAATKHITRVVVAASVRHAQLAVVCPPLVVAGGVSHSSSRNTSLNGEPLADGSVQENVISAAEAETTKLPSTPSSDSIHDLALRPEVHNDTSSSSSSLSSSVSPAIEAFSDPTTNSNENEDGDVSILNGRVSFSSGDSKSDDTPTTITKKSLLAGLSRFTERVRPSAVDDDWEALSVRSGTSSDDEEDASLLRLVADTTELPAFVTSTWVGGEEESEAASASTGSVTDPRNAMVSVIILNCHQLELVARSSGDNTSVAMQVHQLAPEELGNVSLESFRESFVFDSTSATDKLSCAPSTAKPPVRLRYVLGPAAAGEVATSLAISPTSPMAIAAAERGWLQCRITALVARFFTSSLTSLADLVQDEQIVPLMPMFIEINDTTLSLKDDKIPTYPGLPAAIPIDLKLHNILVKRTEDGVMHVSGGTVHSEHAKSANPVFEPKYDETTTQSAPSDSTTNHSSEIDRTKSLEARLAAVELENSKLQRECEQLRKEQHTNKSWIEERDALRAERESLFQTLQRLQEELGASEDIRMRMASVQ